MTSNTGFNEIGIQAGSSGAVDVSGSGSQWNMKEIYVGGDGDGLLRITQGGVVSSEGNISGTGSFISGSQTGSAGLAEVTGNGSLWVLEHLLTVGRSGRGPWLWLLVVMFKHPILNWPRVLMAWVS